MTHVATVKTLAAADMTRAIDTIVLAFAADPMSRWSWPDAHQYLTTMPRLARAFGGRAFAHGSAFACADYTGVALWLPPGVHPDEEALNEVVLGTVPSSNHASAIAIFEQMAQHHPSGPHWYLPLIGVDPAHQGQGYGDALMSHAVAQADRDRLPAYLESTNPRNISLYRRHGFEALGRIQVGTSPPLVPMLRPARTAP